MWNKRFLKDWCAGALMVMAAAVMNPAAAAKASGGTTTKLPYVRTVTGVDLASNVTFNVSPMGGFVLMGGGPDVDPAFRWMISQSGISPRTGGRFVVIRASGDGAYNDYIYYSDAVKGTSSNIEDQWVGGRSMGLTSVETLVIPSVEAANHPTVNQIVGNANAIWIAGGDQSNYIKYWKGTELERTLNSAIRRNVPLGGTSAGLAVLGGFDYSALYKSAQSVDVLKNPYDRNITFDPSPLATSGGFLSPEVFSRTIFDSHLDERDRGGRLVTFLSRLIAKDGTSGCAGGVLNASEARGIGLGVETALVVRPSSGGWMAQRLTNVSKSGRSAVYFVTLAQRPVTCASGVPLETSSSSIEVRTLDATISEVSLDSLFTTGYTWIGTATGGTLLPSFPY